MKNHDEEKTINNKSLFKTNPFHVCLEMARSFGKRKTRRLVRIKCKMSERSKGMRMGRKRSRGGKINSSRSKQ